MSGAESSVTFALRELRLLAQLRLTEAAEAWRATEQARQRAAEQRAERAEQLAREQAAAEHAAQEREWTAALTESQRAAERLAEVERSERARALAAISLHHMQSEAELARLLRAQQRPPWLLALTAVLLGAALTLASAVWRQQLASQRLQHEFGERAARQERAWLEVRVRAEQAAERATRSLTAVEARLEALRLGLAKPTSPKPAKPVKPARQPGRQPAPAPAAPVAPTTDPPKIRISPECLTHVLC